MKFTKIFFLFFIIVLAQTSKGQDTINMRSGEVIVARVSDVGTTEIKYKKWGHSDGPNYTVLKTDVAFIKYQDGSKDVFKDAQLINSFAPNNTTSATQPATAISPDDLQGFTNKADAKNLVDAKGLRQGKWLDYYSRNGQPTNANPVYYTLAIYKDNKIIGIWREYYVNGVLYQDCPYVNGITNGVAHIYKKNGKIMASPVFKDGVLVDEGY